jgi:hypothetical protein
MKTQLFLPYDASTLGNYLAWSKNGISSALSTLGWVRTADTGQVTWANVVSVPSIAPIINSWSAPAAWAGGTTTYNGVAGGAAGAPSIVTNGGLTYACILSTTALALTQALQNTANTFSGTLTTVANASGGNTVYTFSGTPVTANQFQHMQVVITGCVAANNNGTFMCVSNTTTTLTLTNAAGTAATSQTGTATSSASALSFIGTITSGASNAYASHSLIVAGFANGANNGTFTVTSSSTTAFAVTQTGVNETHAGTATENTAPASDTVHWTGYNYEVWQTQDAANSTNPVFLRIVYTTSSGSPKGAQIYIAVGTGTTGTGFVSGATFTNNSAEITLPASTTLAGLGSTGLECDFCVSVSGGSLSMMLWRDAVFTATGVPGVLVLDRAKDNFGQDLDAYVVCLQAASANAREQILYKPGTGGTKIPNSATPFGAWSIPNFSTINTGMAVNNNAPPLPVFPVGLGYLASPCLGAFVMKPTDSVEGALIPVFMYGTTHTFLMGKGNYTTVDAGSGNTAAFVGIRWE